jgi:hypothetical protein
VTSPTGAGDAGGEEPSAATGPAPEASSPDGSSEETPAPSSVGTAAEGTPTSSEPGHDEARPATGIRYAPTEETPATGTPVSDDDPTPPSGVPAGQTTPGTWPHPGFPHQAPPTWQQTAPTPPRDPARRRRVRRIVLAVVLGLVVIAAVVVALLAFLVGPRFARYDVLDRAAVERGVTDVVTRDWHRRITGTTCPADQRVVPGTSFLCTATVDDRPQQIPVDVVDENGTYEVGQPR